jgi:hypothetical protein
MSLGTRHPILKQENKAAPKKERKDGTASLYI